MLFCFKQPFIISLIKLYHMIQGCNNYFRKVLFESLYPEFLLLIKWKSLYDFKSLPKSPNLFHIPAALMQTRWSIIKQRYVDELQKERHAQYSHQGFRSTWEHFDRMNFMRDILLKKVDER